MDKIKCKKGFTYIEVLIAAAVLSVIFIPAVSVFYSASLNQNYAVKYYNAAAQAELAVSAAVRSVENFGIPESGIGSVEFLNDNYLLYDEFDFIITIYDDSGAPAARIGEGVPVSGPPEFLYDGTPEISAEFLISVDVYDKNGKLLIRVCQVIL